VPRPIEPIVTRSLGATAPPFPRADAGIIVGSPIAADAEAIVFMKSLLFMRNIC